MITKSLSLQNVDQRPLLQTLVSPLPVPQTVVAVLVVAQRQRLAKWANELRPVVVAHLLMVAGQLPMVAAHLPEVVAQLPVPPTVVAATNEM